MRTSCGLRSVVKIMDILAEVLGDGLGKTPCYNTVENWVKKLGLAVYQEDKPFGNMKYAAVVDESIAVNGQKLLLTLGIPAIHQGHPIRHENVTVLNMSVGKKFNARDIKANMENVSETAGASPQFVISDNAHNLVRGIKDSGLIHHADISHSMGICLRQTYEKHSDFYALTKLLGKIRLQYHLTGKAYLLPPNMRTIARFMNMSSWVEWGCDLLDVLDKLPEETQTAYSFLKDYEQLLRELKTALNSVRYVEEICKNKGVSLETSKECKLHIIKHVLGNASPRQAHLGLKMLDYFEKEERSLAESMNINISSDIIESTFGVYKSKKSPNKLYGITAFALMIPLYCKITNKIQSRSLNFKELLTRVRQKDVDEWRNKNLSTNWVTERTKTLKKVS